jgi:hypothetical protein
MANQHTYPKYMSVDDRFRLAEIRAFLSPDSLSAVRTCTGYYIAETGFLFRGEKWADLIRMGAILSPRLEDIRRRFPSDTGLAYRIALVRAYRAYALGALGHVEEVPQACGLALETLPSNHSDAGNLTALIYRAWMFRWTKLVETGRHALVAEEMARFEIHCPDASVCRQNRLWLHTQWIDALWKKEKWAEVVEKCRVAAELDEGKNPAIRQNMETAYMNWSGAMLNAKNRRGAAGVLRKCAQDLPGKSKCRTRLKEIE